MQYRIVSYTNSGTQIIICYTLREALEKIAQYPGAWIECRDGDKWVRYRGY